jgi:hypothetical protein
MIGFALAIAPVFASAYIEATPPPPGADQYLRPDGTSLFLRPDGTSTYLRPA